MGKEHVFDAVRAAADRAEARAEGVEQFDLLPPTRFHPIDQPAEHREVVEHVKRDRAGRPPGAKNKTTRQMLDFIRETIGDPMLESARMAMHTPLSLSKELECSVLEAAQLLEKIRADLRPYFYAKQAPVDDTGKVVPGLTVQIGGHDAPQLGHGGEQMPPWLYLQEPPTSDEKSQQNQRLIDVSPNVSHGKPSHEGE